jgi:hypothetical protein
MDAGMRELMTVYRHRGALAHGSAATITGTGGLALAPMAMAGVGEVNVVADTATVAVLDDAPTEVATQPDAKTVFLALLWVLLILLSLGPVLGLPAEAQEIIGGLLANVGLGLIITWRVNDGRKG